MTRDDVIKVIKQLLDDPDVIIDVIGVSYSQDARETLELINIKLIKPVEIL